MSSSRPERTGRSLGLLGEPGQTNKSAQVLSWDVGGLTPEKATSQHKKLVGFLSFPSHHDLA